MSQYGYARCLNCGTSYYMENGADCYCSDKCRGEDDARLAEGNRIIDAAAKAETEFKPIDAIRLDTQGPIGVALKGLNLRTPGDRTIKGVEQILQQSEATQHVPASAEVNNFQIQSQNDIHNRMREVKHEIINEYDKSGNLGTD